MSESDKKTFGEMLQDAQDDPIAQQAKTLAMNDYEFQFELVKLRQSRGYTIQQVAERMGVSKKKVKDFESYWYDPSLSELRRYALAISVVYSHEVTAGDIIG